MPRKTVKEYTQPECPNCGKTKLGPADGPLRGILRCLSCGSYAFLTKYTQDASVLVTQSKKPEENGK